MLLQFIAIINSKSFKLSKYKTITKIAYAYAIFIASLKISFSYLNIYSKLKLTFRANLLINSLEPIFNALIEQVYQDNIKTKAFAAQILYNRFLQKIKKYFNKQQRNAIARYIRLFNSLKSNKKIRYRPKKLQFRNSKNITKRLSITTLNIKELFN